MAAPDGVVAPSAIAVESRARTSTSADTVERLTQIVSDYLLISPNDQFKRGGGRDVLSSQIDWHVKQNLPIELVLPGFPFKSPSTKQVLGLLPDFAEEIGLRRLENLCRALEDVYSPGAHLKIVSDGIVYSQLLGVTDSTAYQYGAELRRIVSSFHLDHISFFRVRDLLSGDGKTRSTTSDLSESEYLVDAPITRDEFLLTNVGSYDADAHMKSNESVRHTYHAYMGSLMRTELERGRNEAELSSEETRERLSSVAKRMMSNGAKFSALVERAFPHAVRFSIHAQKNSGPKFSLMVFPNDDSFATPWHNTAVIKLDGSIAIQHSQLVNKETHELVYKYGRPYFWREKDPAMQWGKINGVQVTFEHMLPFGLLIQPATTTSGTTGGGTISWSDIPMDKIRALASKYSLILARGFEPVDQDEYHRKASELGPIQSSTWGGTGEAAVLGGDSSKPPDELLRKTEEDGTQSPDPAQFQMFQCRHAPTVVSSSPESENAGCITLFANMSMIYQQLIENGASPYVKSGRALPIVQTNPLNRRSVIRLHEPWPKHLTAHPTHSSVIELGADTPENVEKNLAGLLYDRRFLYRHTWQTGDYVIADNRELMHTFHAYDGEFWRIQLS